MAKKNKNNKKNNKVSAPAAQTGTSSTAESVAPVITGTYTFKWEHPAEEVYVTGTFDDWTKSVKLDKEDGVFQKTVDLKDASKKIYYKFVVDNNWTTNDSAPKEPDQEGNVNNFLIPEQLVSADPAAAVINTVTPTATTAAMAGEVPKEVPDATATPSDVPGGFPETPAEDAGKIIGVNPYPAADGAVNPVAIAAGAPVPPPATAEEINKNVKLDKESYEKSDTLPGVAAAPAIDSKPVIPESGLPVTDNTISSVGPGATTAILAGQVPKEPKGQTVPETVKESQDKAGVDPEASADPEEVREKAEVEQELKTKVPEAAATTEGTAGVGIEKGENTSAPVAAITTAGGAIAGAAIAAKDTAIEKGAPVVNQAAAAAADAADKNLPDSVKEKLPIAAQEAISSQSKEETREQVSPEVPTEVKQSITEAGKSPEAAANTSAVVDKKEVESELLKEVKTAPAAGEGKGKEASADPKPEQPVTDAPKAAEPLKPTEQKTEANQSTANGSGSKNGEQPAAANGADQKKKKNRISSILSKIKHKLSDK